MVVELKEAVVFPNHCSEELWSFTRSFIHPGYPRFASSYSEMSRKYADNKNRQEIATLQVRAVFRIIHTIKKSNILCDCRKQRSATCCTLFFFFWNALRRRGCPLIPLCKATWQIFTTAIMRELAANDARHANCAGGHVWTAHQRGTSLHTKLNVFWGGP